MSMNYMTQKVSKPKVAQSIFHARKNVRVDNLRKLMKPMKLMKSNNLTKLKSRHIQPPHHRKNVRAHNNIKQHMQNTQAKNKSNTI